VLTYVLLDVSASMHRALDYARRSLTVFLTSKVIASFVIARSTLLAYSVRDRLTRTLHIRARRWARGRRTRWRSSSTGRQARTALTWRACRGGGVRLSSTRIRRRHQEPAQRRRARGGAARHGAGRLLQSGYAALSAGCRGPGAESRAGAARTTWLTLQVAGQRSGGPVHHKELGPGCEQKRGSQLPTEQGATTSHPSVTWRRGCAGRAELAAAPPPAQPGRERAHRACKARWRLGTSRARGRQVGRPGAHRWRRTCAARTRARSSR